MSDDPAEPDPDWIAEARMMHGLPVLQPDPRVIRQRDASDPEAIAEARRKQRLAERTIATTIHEMMQLREVRAVIYRWLAVTRAFEAHDFPFGATIDPLQLARNAAHREVAQFILADLHRSAPNEYLLMLKEASGSGQSSAVGGQ
jgi:ribosome-interacting GTPase 1